MLLAAIAWAQTGDDYRIDTVAGGGAGGLGDDGPAIAARLSPPRGVAVDGAGNVYIAAVGRIRKVDALGIITTIVGGGSGYSGDGGPAIAARVSGPRGVAVDGAGNVYFADSGNNRIRKIDAATGTIATIAGTGVHGFSGDGGPAVEAQISRAGGVAVDGAGNVYFADSGNNRIRKIDAATGTIATIAGTGVHGFSGDGGPATEAQISRAEGVAVDGAGNVYFADYGNYGIRKVDSSGIITTIAGGGVGFGGDGGRAVGARLSPPRGVAVDGAGNVYIADSGNDRIRKVNASGIITTIAGTGEEGLGGDGGLAVEAQIHNPFGVAVDGAGNVYIADSGNHRIRKLTPTGPVAQIPAIPGGSGSFSISATTPYSLAVEWREPENTASAITDYDVRYREAGSGGGFTDAQHGGTARTATLTGLRPDTAYEVQVRATNAAGTGAWSQLGIVRTRDDYRIDTVAGGGAGGLGDDGPAIAARLSPPRGVAVDGAGNVYIAAVGRIRKVDALGIITTIVGGGSGYSGAGGPAIAARVSGPRGVAVDGAGNVYFADSGNNRIRKIDAATGTIATIAGTGVHGFSGDGGPAVEAQISRAGGVAVDGAGNVYFADSGNNRIRKIDAATGTIATIAGTGVHGFSGDGGPATEAQISRAEGVAVDGAGNVYFADYGNYGIRKVDSSGIITTIAGGGVGFGGDGGRAVGARLSPPRGVAVDGAGNVYIADSGNDRIRKVNASGIITTIAGTGEEGLGGDGGLAVEAQIHNPFGVAVDGAGNVYIADSGNHRIRKLTPSGSSGISPGGGGGDGSSDSPGTGTESFSIPNLGGRSTTSSGIEATTQVGYGRIRAEAGSTTPAGIAIFGFRQGGVLIAEAGVPATEAVRQGRIFAEVNGPVNTGLAIANPNDAPATIAFYFTGAEGARFGEGSFELGAHEQTAKFLDQAPFNGGPSVLGTFTFTSSAPVAVVALRGFTNESGEFLMTTLPVAPLVAPPTPFSTNTGSAGTVYFPLFADGRGWATQVVLVNPTDDTIAGTVRFLGPGSGAAAAAPAVLTLDDDRTGSSFDYSIPPRGSQRFTTSNPSDAYSSGSVRATPGAGSIAPSGLVVFSFTPGGKTVSEAGVPALAAGSAFRVYVESSGTSEPIGSIRTGLAITNVAGTANTVTLEVTDLGGTLAAPPDTLTLPPSGQVARYIDDFFDSLPSNFSGVLRVTSTADVAIVGLRLRFNDRGELKMTTTPPSDETGASTMADLYFPHILDSGGWSTQFVLFSGTAGQASAGTLSFIDTAGEPWDLPTILP